MSRYHGIRIGSRLLQAFALAALIAVPFGLASCQGADLQLTREQLREIQTSLNQLRFDAGTADGLLGPQSRSGVQAFRAAHGYDTSAPLNQRLLERVREAVAAGAAIVTETRR